MRWPPPWYCHKHGRVETLRLLILSLAVVAVGHCAADSLGLELVRAAGERHRLFRNSNSGIEVITAQGAEPVHGDAHWEVRGELADARAVIAWSPKFGLARRPERPGRTRPEFDALVELTASAPGFWRTADLKDGIAVFLWLSDGRPTQINPVPMRTVQLKDGQVVANARFRLSEPEARGAPVVLLLRQNQWMAPLPSSAGGHLDHAIADLHQTGISVPPAGLTPAMLSVTAEDDTLKLLEAVVASSHAELIAPLLARLPEKVLARQAGPLLEVAVDRLRQAETVDLLRGLERYVSDRQLAALIERAIANRDGESVQNIVAWAVGKSRAIPETEKLAALALGEGLDRATSVLAGQGLRPLIAKRGPDHFAELAHRGRSDMIRRLLANGVNPARADREAAALSLAAQTGDAELVAQLLSAGAKPDPATALNASPLSLAARAGHRSVVTALLKAGADPLRRGPAGANVLYAAILSSDVDMVPWLLSQGVRLPKERERATELLETALRLHRPGAVAALFQAGARLPSVGGKLPELLRAAVALDQADLVEAALRNGWDARAPLDGDWTLATVAAAFEAPRSRALLERIAARAAEENFGSPHQPPVPLELLLNGVRPPTLDHQEAKLTLRGVVDARGSFRCVTVSGTDDVFLAFAVRRAAARFRFKPALRDGRPVDVVISLPLLLSSQPRQVVALSELDLPPVQIKTAGSEAMTYVPPVLGLSRWATSMGPIMGMTDIDYVIRSLASTGLNIPGLTVAFVVAEDGTTRDAKLLTTADRFEGDAVLAQVAKFRFLPGIARGRAVSVSTVQQVALP